MLSAISCYKFHISKDQQENMKSTIICHLATFFVINKRWLNDSGFHVLLFIFWNMKYVTGYGWKQINLTLQTIAGYNVSSVVLVFSILNLGRILITDLVVTNLLMYSLSDMILLYLATPFLHWRCYCMRYRIIALYIMIIHITCIIFSAPHF